MSLWIVIFPFDVVKSRMQIYEMNISMVSLFVKIGRDEGITYYLVTWLLLNSSSC